MSESAPPDPVALGNAMKRVRKFRGKSQEQVANASGMRSTTYKEIENATVIRKRRPGTFENIAASLDVTLQFLYDLANNRASLEELENPVMRMIKEMREEFNGKFDSLEDHLRKLNDDRARQHEDLVKRFDALDGLIRSPGVHVDLDRYHSQDQPEE